MKRIAKLGDPTVEKGFIIETNAKTTFVHGRPMAVGRIRITRPSYIPPYAVMVKSGGGPITVEGQQPFTSSDYPLSPQETDALIG